MRRVQDDHDVVPDSEPEREERRRQRTCQLLSQSTTASASPLERDIHSTCHNVTNGHMTHKPALQIDHSASVPEQSGLGPPAITSRTCPSPPPIATIESLPYSDTDQEDQVSLMQISRFAYQPPQQMPKLRPEPQTGDLRNPGPSRLPSVAGQKKDATSEVCPGHLTDTHLARLLKCVGCGLQWTSRKTTKQKRVHIKQCAKKNALTKETTRILIEKAIGSSTQSHTCDENATSTLMDSVVPIVPTKKTKRQQIVPTVRSLPETRETILNRARHLLGSPRNSEDGAVGDPANKERSEIQFTQPFGKSLLARRNTEDPTRPALLEANGVIEELAGTQPFGASSLGAVKARRLIDDFDKCSPPSTQQFGTSKLVQAPRPGNDGFNSLQKRPVSPPSAENSDRAVKRRLVC